MPAKNRADLKKSVGVKSINNNINNINHKVSATTKKKNCDELKNADDTSYASSRRNLMKLVNFEASTSSASNLEGPPPTKKQKPNDSKVSVQQLQNQIEMLQKQLSNFIATS